MRFFKSFVSVFWLEICIAALLAFFLVVFIAALHGLANTRYENENTDLKISMEQAYFEGQKDAIENDIRIKNVNDKWIWITSCWDGVTSLPIYNPNIPLQPQLRCYIVENVENL